MSIRVYSLLLALMVVVVGCEGLDGTRTDPDGNRGSISSPVNGYATNAARIYVDESGADWTDVTVRHADAGDNEQSLDIERLWVAHDAHYLFLRMKVGRRINLQEDNALTLYLDTDNDPTTGNRALGIGAELSWTFGERAGQVVRGGTVGEVNHADIGLTSLPTVRSRTFEIALERSATPIGSRPLFQGDSLRIALSNNGDRLPNEDGGVGYVLTGAETTLSGPSIGKPEGAAIRLLSYNSVNNFEEDRSAIFMADRQPSFRRIFEAVAPDILAFQEIYAQTAAQTDSIENELGLSEGWTWAKEGQDLVLGSRFSILNSHAIPGYKDYRSGAFLLDTGSALGSRLVVITMHPPCCNEGPEGGEPSSNAQRQLVVDGVVAFLREIKQGEGPFEVEPRTPIVVLGDMNFVGDPQQPRTLRTGEIVNTDRFGAPAAPDWDGSALLDTKPRQTATPMHTTWIDPRSSFPPGRLDYAYVSDSVLKVLHEFVLYTPALSESTLSTHGLQASDTKTASDHLPLVIDVTSR